jgi:hypothetical protein
VIVAIVNDNSVDADFDVTVFDISDQFVGTTRVNIPAKTQFSSNIASLIQELPQPAEDFLGSIRISSVDNSIRFYALGVFREGTEFTAFPATQLETTSPETVLIANFTNGNTNFFRSRVYLWNPSDNDASITVRVFSLTRSGPSELLGTANLDLIEAETARNIRLEDIFVSIGLPAPYEENSGNITLEFTVGADNVRGSAQVFNNSLTLAFGTYPLQVIP